MCLRMNKYCYSYIGAIYSEALSRQPVTVNDSFIYIYLPFWMIVVILDLNVCLFENGILRNNLMFSQKFNLELFVPTLCQEFTFHLTLLPEFRELSVEWLHFFFGNSTIFGFYSLNFPRNTTFLHFEVSLIFGFGRTEDAVNF